LQEIIDEADYTKEKIGTDLDSYEGSLESNAYCFSDISDEIEEIKKLLNMKRINKDKIWNAVKRMEDLISNQI